jgi:two-component system, NtrC family, sensor kinase
MPVRGRPVTFGVTVRLGAAFLTVLLLFGASLGVTMSAFDSLAVAERDVSVVDEARQAGHIVASLVREEYIHQAHTIIEGDRSHLDHYQVAARNARDAAARLLRMPLAHDERPQALEVGRLVAVIDEQFHALILPAVDARDHERVHELHERTEKLVNRVVAVNDELNRRLERRSSVAKRHEEALRQRAVALVLGCFGLAILVTAGAWFFLGGSVLQRISELRKGALLLAGGDLRTRIPVRGADEFADLGTTFNDMAASLESHQRKLIQSERLAVLGQFSAGIAHEINNPLGVILGYLKLLGRSVPEGGTAAEQVRIVEDEARHCQRIVQGLLELSRPGQARRTSVNLADTARAAVERLVDTGKLGARTVTLPASSPEASASGDPAALRQVVSNLVLNAVEATPEAGSITLRVRRENGWVELDVEDDGAGLSPDALDRAFDPFYTTKPKGTGLGLPISQAIASAHDGALELHSAEGKGTCARLRLPATLDGQA